MKEILSVFILFFFNQYIYCQYSNSGIFKQPNPSVFHISNIPTKGVVLDKNWKFHAGDLLDCAKPDFDDSQWQNVNPTHDIYDLPKLKDAGVGWFRIHLYIDSSLFEKSLAIMIQQMGASEIYLNGNKIYSFGNISNNQNQISTFDPLNIPAPIYFTKTTAQVLAVRYAYKKNIPYFIFAGRPNSCLVITINSANRAISIYSYSETSYNPDLFRSGLFFILSILHFSLYIFYPKKKANLFFSLFAMVAVPTNIIYIIATNTHNTELRMYLLWLTIILFNLYNLLFLKALDTVVQNKKKIIYRILSACFLLSIPLYFFPYHSGWILGFTILPNAILLECSRTSFLAMKRKQKGAIILTIGAIIFFIFYLSFYLAKYVIPSRYLTSSFYDITYMIGVISLPIATSIFLALEFAFTNRSLETQLAEVQRLSRKTTAQELEKQQILSDQKRLLEKEVIERTAELTQRRKELEKTLENLKLTQSKLLRSEKEKMLVQHERALHELEAKALRAQMNPHFIFNCMNSIKSLIQKDEQEKSILYLTTFSKLIRTIFQNSDKREITLFDEIETCRLYMQLESMRFGNKFNYTFNVDESIDLKSVMVPALIIQPFIENAIWHGIMPKEDGGTVSVTVDETNHTLRCVIDDDGVGREMSNQNKFRAESAIYESKGVRLTQARLDLDNLLNEKKAGINIIDKKNENGQSSGTTIILRFEY